MDPELLHEPNNLKAVVRLCIENADTIAVVNQTLGIHTECLDCFLGKGCLTWDVDTAEARALLGTPNGAGVAWLLSQHQKELGHKVVERVTLFWKRCYEYGGVNHFKQHPSLVFHLKDVVA